MRNRWITLFDSRSGRLSFTGWTGVQKSGYSDVFKDMMRKLRHANETVTFADVLKGTAPSSGYGNLSIKCCPQCGTFIIRTQCCCLRCGMIATFQGSGAEITFSPDTVFEPSSAAATPAAGFAQRSGDVAPVTPPRTTAEEDIE